VKEGFKADHVERFSGSEQIYFTFEVLPGRAWTFDFDECLHYFSALVDSCPAVR